LHEPLETAEAAEDVPTITTVARLANVSVASASRVLNGIRTSPATLERVTAAAEAVGYVPNAAARSLRSRRTGQIAFAMPDVGNPVYTAMVASIQEVARVASGRDEEPHRGVDASSRRRCGSVRRTGARRGHHGDRDAAVGGYGRTFEADLTRPQRPR